ncbi:hypothetical protein VNO78_12353 [Psophocarpus tetragonolobus]|uniref:Uncharacterized protein n=1 Tax=Psophocarpus tetragonolobus TaxID=3891 RepID=A0AAN9SNT5_PSOTE
MRIGNTVASSKAHQNGMSVLMGFEIDNRMHEEKQENIEMKQAPLTFSTKARDMNGNQKDGDEGDRIWLEGGSSTISLGMDAKCTKLDNPT